MPESNPATDKPLPLSAMNISFLVAVHVVGITGLVLYLVLHGLSTAALVIGLVWTELTIFAISAGYHRLFSHRSYEAHPILQFLLLCFGAAAFQNTALTWSADHRRHHKFVDTDWDPYNAQRGFWYSHIGWVMQKGPPGTEVFPVPDLQRMPLLQWQQRYFPFIGAIVGIVAPALLGLALGDFWGGLVVGGVFRLVVTFHVTFSINSFAHWLGYQPYSDVNSSRDSFITALITMGEGYHNYHHTFPIDYRNGFRFWQFDPTKWVVCALAVVRLTRNLRRAPLPLVERARWIMEERRLATRRGLGAASETTWQLHRRLDDLLTRWHEVVADDEAKRRHGEGQTRSAMRARRREARALRRQFDEAHIQWRRSLRPGAARAEVASGARA
jgi:stearoyl-CoA desaturase (Delta-9 desaturase)